MTDIDDAWLAERERMEKAATPGPWRATEERVYADLDDGAVCVASPNLNFSDRCAPDAAFIADARAAVPALVAEVRRLREENERLRIKRCHYCDAPMKEKEFEKDGVIVGMQYQCSGGCP